MSEAISGEHYRIRAEGATARYLFGSVARDQARADSDLDVFVDYEPEQQILAAQLGGGWPSHHGRDWMQR
jgi:predicted nucleotidyltransferase